HVGVLGVACTAQRAADADRAEARGDPAVPGDALPDPWSPRVVAQAEAGGHIEALLPHFDHAGDRHLLLGVAAREGMRRPGGRLLTLVPLGFAARRLRGRGDPELEGARYMGVALERAAGIGHLARVGEQADHA